MPLPAHRVLFDEAALARRVAELAEEVRTRSPVPEVLMVGLLDGSFIFLADLARALSRAGLEPRVELARTSSYGTSTTSGRDISVLHDPTGNLEGRAVLLVDDILDTGRTLKTMRDRLATRAPSWLATCVLLDKPARREVDIAPDFVGFAVPDAWIIGYGLDLAGAGRALPYVAQVTGRSHGPGAPPAR